MPINHELELHDDYGDCIAGMANLISEVDKDTCFLYAYLQETLCNTPHYMQEECEDYATEMGEDTTACTTNSDKRSGFFDADHEYGYAYTGTSHEEYNTSPPGPITGLKTLVSLIKRA